MAVELNWTGDDALYRGDTILKYFAVKQTNGDPVDLANRTYFYTIKKNQTDLDAAALVKTTITPTAPTTDGLFTLSVPHTDTAALLGEYYHDLQYVTASGSPSVISRVKTVFAGAVEFKSDITIRTSGS